MVDVVVVGAGVAGLAAAVALSGAGASVVLLERKPYVGGRAYSYLHPALDEVIDLAACAAGLLHESGGYVQACGDGTEDSLV